MYANFTGFSEKRDRLKFAIPCSQIEMRKFVYAFFQINSLENQTEPYIHFLKNNFSAKKLYFDKETLTNWLMEGKKLTQAEITASIGSIRKKKPLC